MRHILVEENGGAEVKPGMRVLTFRNEIYELIGFTVPGSDASTGRVQVKKPGEQVLPGHGREYYPSVFGLKIVTLHESKDKAK
jgi:hypothetical protein